MANLKQITDQISEQLSVSLPWLDNAFGLAQRVEREVDGEKYTSPAYYSPNQSRKNDYTELLPDRHLGNYCFFWHLDPERYKSIDRSPGVFRSPVALIFWFDTNDVFGQANVRDIESVKMSILTAIRKDLRLSAGHFDVAKIYNHGPNIFREFSLEEIDNQSLLHPYAGLRFEGEIIFDAPC